MKLSMSFLLYAAGFSVAAPALQAVGHANSTAYDGGITATDVEDGVCASLTLIFARGSTERGNMGSGVGPALAKSLIEDIGASRIAVQGVKYEATIMSNLWMGLKGGPVMVSLATQASSQCPFTKIILSGYSQGCEVVRNALMHSSLNVSSVSSILLFGDPASDMPTIGGLPRRKVMRFCAADDPVCEHEDLSQIGKHRSYATNGAVNQGVKFVRRMTNL